MTGSPLSPGPQSAFRITVSRFVRLIRLPPTHTQLITVTGKRISEPPRLAAHLNMESTSHNLPEMSWHGGSGVSNSETVLANAAMVIATGNLIPASAQILRPGRKVKDGSLRLTSTPSAIAWARAV